MLPSSFMSKPSAKWQKTKPRAAGEGPPPDTPKRAVAPPVWLAFLERHGRHIAIAAVLLATVRIVATYDVFSHTFDEPTHIATGMEWLDKGSYTWEVKHPPLARVATAIGPYLLGRRNHRLPNSNPASRDPNNNKEHEGLAVLYEGHDYDRTLAVARAGILPFFWIACLVVWTWSSRAYGFAAGAVATVIFTFIPPVLAHAGLATTDMAVAAGTGAAFLCGMMWLERPDRRRTLLFGAAVALAVLSKFSSLVFLPAAAALAGLAWVAVERPGASRLAHLRSAVPMLGVAVLTACVLIWAGYRFSYHGYPAPELFHGIGDVMDHNRAGNLSYFMGRLSMKGSWQFFPVVLGVKTPLALLILCLLWAAVPQLRARWRTIVLPLAFSTSVLLVGMAANINLGIRHILPIYIGIAIIAGVGALELLQHAPGQRWVKPVLGVLVLWFGVSSVRAHPDYLPYFNELALGKPEKIVVDSDLEWGQDFKRLANRLRQIAPPSVFLLTEELAEFGEHGMPRVSTNIDGYRPSVGWTATDVTYWKERRMGLGLRGADITMWLDRLPPTEKVGAGYYLWYFPPARQ
jgi:4-amino-4-deoxy-L-arabinose transferase-like glycosyltransferase